jgi:hypothetical protein
MKKVKRIPGYEDYGVDSGGNVWSFKRGTPIQLSLLKAPPMVMLSVNGVRYKKSVNQLIGLLEGSN